MEQTALASDNGTAQKSPNMLLLAGSALGVVFGDIGTSPLYILKRSFCFPAAARRQPPLSACCR